MRFNSLRHEDFALMGKAGCRMILWGFESANQSTVDRINKGYPIQSVCKDLIAARTNGIWNHLTVMFGYPWETLEEEKRTYKMVKWLLLKDWVASAQATIFMPYPGTELFKWAKENDLLLTEDWDEYDMSKPVMKLKYDPKWVLKFQRGIYNVSFHPKFIFNKLVKIKTWDDFKYYFRITRKIIDRFGNVVNNPGVSIDG